MEKAIDNNDSFNWFSLRVISGKERIVEDTILYESKRENVEDSIEEVFVPFEKVVKIVNSKKVIKERVFFPGYILIKMARRTNRKNQSLPYFSVFFVYS